MQRLAECSDSQMVKFTLPMIYENHLDATYYLDQITSDAAIYNTDGHFWSYKRYQQYEIGEVVAKAKASGTYRQPPQTQNQNQEL